MSQLSSASPSGIEIKFQLPNEKHDSRLFSVECHDDVVAMLGEFEASQRIPVYVFDADGSVSFLRENTIPSDPQEFVDAEDDLIPLSGTPYRKPQACDCKSLTPVNSQTSPSTSELVNGRDSQNLAVGQEFLDAQTFRNALVKTLKGKYSCVRPDRSSHRQARMKWILNCIVDRIRENINYKPKETMKDLEQEYGVIIPYLKAHRAKEQALELIFGMPIKDIVLNQGEVQGIENPMNDMLDQQRKKPLKGSLVHCNLCKKTGHNKRCCMKLRIEQPTSPKEKKVSLYGLQTKWT